MLFVMLRDAIGEDTFRRGIRAFWEKHLFRAASWTDLPAALEKASGTSLQAFFEQWLNRSGGPEVRIADATAKPEAGKIRLTLALEQSAPAYALRLPLEIVFPDHSETRWVGTDRESEVLTLDMDARPDSVRVDPELRVWRMLEPEQLPPILRQWVTAGAPRLALASTAREVREAARLLSSRFFETRPREISLQELNQSAEPVLLAGLHADVDVALARAGLPPRPTSLAGRGSAQVWTTIRKAWAPVAVVSARDAEALRALLRPLPHYGAQSWLVFEGARAVERGVWPAAGRLVPVRSR
jgi:aminopeptidase N